VPLLIVANLLWFFVGLVMVLRAGLPVWPYLSEGYAGILHKTGAVNGFDLFRGEWWRLATSCFVHIGGAHLLLNLFALVVIGPLAEELWGRARFIIIYVLSGLAGGCLAMALSPESMLAGASGAIWGLLTSLVAWLMLFGRTLDPVEAAESKRRLAVVIVLNAMFSLVPGVSWQGHLGGGIAGFVVAVLLNAIGTGDRPRRVLALALLAAFAVGTVGGLLSAMRWHQAWAGYRQLLAHERTTEEMRLALEKTKQAIQEAGEAYDRDVAPLLMELSPEKSKVAMGLASNQLIKMGDRRNKARVAEARVRLTELKRIADTVIELLTVAPVGVDVIDRHRQRARAFAAARSRSVALVLAMLDSPDIPDASAWAEWEKAKSEADALWPQLAR
jgi:membrane associated rhomboid family serine protease